MPDKFFTKETVASLYGATLIVLVTSSYTALLFQSDPRWMALFLSQAVAFIGLAALPLPSKARRWSLISIFLAFANGALLYCSATGINTINHGLGNQGDAKKDQAKANLVPALDPAPWWPPPAEVKRLIAQAERAGAAAQSVEYNSKLRGFIESAGDSSRSMRRLTNELQRAVLSQQAIVDSFQVQAIAMEKKARDLGKLTLEAAIGSLKKRTEDQAHAQGRGGQWALADLGAAQTAANAGHPRRLNGRTPASVWESRRPIDPVERVIFQLKVERQRFRVRDELRIDPEELLDHWRASAVDRHAIERALVEHGHLLFTRRRIPLTIRAGKVTRDV